MAKIHDPRGEGVRRFTVSLQADDRGGFEAVLLNGRAFKGGYLLSLKTVPGLVSPSAGFNVRLLARGETDLLQGVGLARQAKPQHAIVRLADSDAHPICDGRDLALVVDSNATPWAMLEVSIFYGTGR